MINCSLIKLIIYFIIDRFICIFYKFLILLFDYIFNKKTLIIKMAPYFGTYHLSKNSQNTIQECKMAFGTPFLVTPIGVALRSKTKWTTLLLSPSQVVAPSFLIVQFLLRCKLKLLVYFELYSFLRLRLFFFAFFFHDSILLGANFLLAFCGCEMGEKTRSVRISVTYSMFWVLGSNYASVLISVGIRRRKEKDQI